MSFKIGFLFLVAADLELICWLKVETFLNDLTVNLPHGWYPHTRSFFATLDYHCREKKIGQGDPPYTLGHAIVVSTQLGCFCLQNSVLSFRENTTSQKMKKRVLVPSPYFNRRNNEKSTSLSEASSQHILYSSSFSQNFRNNTHKCPIEPTVINLNDKLPELGKDRNLSSRFPAQNRTKTQRGSSSVIKSPDSNGRNTVTWTSTITHSSAFHRKDETWKDLQS